MSNHIHRVVVPAVGVWGTSCLSLVFYLCMSNHIHRVVVPSCGRMGYVLSVTGLYWSLDEKRSVRIFPTILSGDFALPTPVVES